MSYRALLFCADDKASRAVTQVFRELDFNVETSHEPFDAVKRLTGQHFDALVVDCDNEENATLLFKSARNSAANNNSLAVAVVEGQANIAKAFRLGANLVLTKPINLEQAKGTLRVARGLLRKAETGKLNAGSPSSPAELQEDSLHPLVFQNSVLKPVPMVTQTPSASASIEHEAEVLPKPGPADAALLESMPQPVVAQPKSAAQATGVAPAKDSPWTNKTEILEPKPVAVDAPKKPAKEEPRSAAQVSKQPSTSSKPSGTPRFASLGINANEAATPEQSKKNFWIAAVIVLALGGAVYYGWTKYHPAIQLPFTQDSNPVPAPPAPPAPKPPAEQAISAPAADAATTSTSANSAATSSDSTPPAVPSAAKTPAGLVKVPESVAEGLLIKRVDPNYPDQARDQKLDGLVQLRANINKAGDVTSVKALHGNALLVDAATAAVKQWKYKPYYVNGAPTDIETSITLNLKQ